MARHLHNWEFLPKKSTKNKRTLSQLRVLGSRLLQDGDVGVAVEERITEPSSRISASSAEQYHSNAGIRQAVRSGL